MFGRAADQRVVFEYLHGFGDQVDGFDRCGRVDIDEKIHEPIEVGERLSGVDQARQARAFGFEADLPCARVRR